MNIKRKILIGVALTIFYFATRLVYITKIPIFTDEAIYIRWGQIALQDAAQRFISLEDGKQPLFIWLMLPFLKFISDPLTAGRLVSVSAGLLSLAGLTFLSHRLFGNKVSFLTGFIYIISPFFLLYDRLALYDSLTTATVVWSLFLGTLVTTTLRLDTALLFGMSVGAGLLTKSSADFALILFPATLILIISKWTRKKLKHNFFKWIGLATISVFLTLIIANMLRLAPLYYTIGLKNLTFIVSFQEFLSSPFSRVIGNLRGLFNWTFTYLTLPFIFLLVIGIYSGLKKSWSKTILLLIWFTVPFVTLGAFGRVLYPRFILFMLAPLLPLVALGLNKILDLKLHYCLLFTIYCLLFAYPIYFSSQIIFNPLNAPLPLVDRNQLLDDWPSGYGIPEVITLLKQKAQNNKIFVGTEGTFGLTPSALEIYLIKNPNISIKGYWPISDGIPELIQIAKSGKETYVLFKDTQIPRPEWPLIEIARYQKGRGNVYTSLYLIQSKL